MKPLTSPSVLQSFQLAAFFCLLGTAILMRPMYPHAHTRGGPPVLLPRTSSPSVIDDRPTDILVKIDAAGCRWVGRRWAPEAEFRQAIRHARAASPLGRLVLQADRTLPYGAVRALLADLRDEDIYTLSLIVAPPPQETFGLVGAQ